MADVWISRKRWTCKYCNVTINDDVPSRQHHESGLRHKHNVERALRDLYRETEQRRREEARTRPGGEARPGAAAPRRAGQTNRFAGYTSAEQLGFKDEGAEEWKAKVANRKGEAAPGEWQTVTPEAPRTSAPAHAEHAPPRPEPVAPMTERDEARAFELVEKAAPLHESDDEELEIRVNKRPRVGAAGDADATGEVAEAPREAERFDVKQEPSADQGDTASEAPSAAETADQSSSVARAGNLPPVGPRAQPRGATEQAEVAAPSEPQLFRKRKARGATKKVGGDAFA